jgi:hypothetical protein
MLLEVYPVLATNRALSASSSRCSEALLQPRRILSVPGCIHLGLAQVRGVLGVGIPILFVLLGLLRVSDERHELAACSSSWF